MRLSLVGCFVSVCLPLFLTSAATADPLYATSLSSNLDAGRAEGGYETGVIPNSDDAGPLSDTVSDQGATATSTASVVDGTLHAFVSTISSSSWSAFGNVRASFYDTFMLKSATLPLGTLVPILISIVPSYTFTTTGDARGVFQSTVSASIPDVEEGEFETIGQLFYSDSVGWGSEFPFSFTTTSIFNVPIGQEFRISASLFVSASADGANASTVDALNTLKFFVDSEHPYSTASGNSYESIAQVPEPATLSLLGFGIAGALAARKRCG